jgi:hypothetical protein
MAQVITQLTIEDVPAGEPAGTGPAQRGFGLLVPAQPGIWHWRPAR